jgi:hypothetical protein
VSNKLLPAESIAFTIAKSQLERGDDITPNIAGVLVLALDRLVNGNDWRPSEESLPREGDAGKGD